MKTNITSITCLLLTSATLVFAQAPEKMVENILQRDGVFYPSHTVIGKAFYDGKWFNAIDVTSENASWRANPNTIANQIGYSSLEEMARDWGYHKGADLNMLAQNFFGAGSIEEAALWSGAIVDGSGEPDYTTLASWYGYPSLEAMYAGYGYPSAEAMAQDFGYASLEDFARASGAVVNGIPDITYLANMYGHNTIEDFAISQNYTIPDGQSLLDSFGGATALANYYGIPLESHLLNHQQKGSVIEAIRNGTMPEETLRELFESDNYESNPYVYALTNENGTTDTQFLNKLLATLKEKESPALQDVFKSAAAKASQDPSIVDQIDFTGWTEIPRLAGFPIKESNLTWDQINSAGYIQEGDFSGMDVSQLNTNGKAYYHSDFSNTNLTGTQLSQMNVISSINVDGTNLSGFNGLGRAIYSTDLGNTTGLTGANLAGIIALQNSNLGAMNMTGFSVSPGTSLAGSNFSQTTNLSGASLNNASSLQSTNLSGKNLTGFNPHNKVLFGANLSNTTGLTAAQIAQASNIKGLNLQGTLITKLELDAALTAIGKNPASSNYDTSTVKF